MQIVDHKWYKANKHQCEELGFCISDPTFDLANIGNMAWYAGRFDVLDKIAWINSRELTVLLCCVTYIQYDELVYMPVVLFRNPTEHVMWKLTF